MIFNAIAAGTVPEYIWVEYEITKVAGLPWKLVERSGGYSSPYDNHGGTIGPFYPDTKLDANTGKITGKGTPKYVNISGAIPGTDLPAEGWMAYGDTFEYLEVVAMSYDPRYYYLNGTRTRKSEPTYTTTYGAIKTIHLTEQTGDQFRKIPIIK